MEATRTRQRSAETPTRPGLTREQIVEVAVALVDAEGLDRLTLRRLADHLGVTPMALYWHFRDKEALLAALGEMLFSSIDYPPAVEDWARDLDAVMLAVLEALRRHPAIAPLALTTVLSTVPGLELSERVLSLLCDAGLEDAVAANVGGFLLYSVVALVAAVPEAEKSPSSLPDGVDPSDFPVAMRLAPHLIDCEDVDGFMREGLSVLSEGVRGMVARATSATPLDA